MLNVFKGSRIYFFVDYLHDEAHSEVFIKFGLHYQSFCGHNSNFAWYILSCEGFVRNM